MLERDVVIGLYKENIITYNRSVVLYGTGRYTRDIIESFPEGGIVGVCDEKYPEKTFSGKPVLPISSVHKYSNTLVLIARPLYHFEIVNRLKRLGLSSEVEIITIGGENAQKSNRLSSWSEYRDILKGKIQTAGDELIYNHFFVKASMENDVSTIMAPYLVAYLSWMKRRLSDCPMNSNLWFVARDGYYIHRLFEKYIGVGSISIAKDSYVYGSRRAFSVIQIYDENDIEDVTKYKLTSGSLGDVLKNRFGLVISNTDKRADLAAPATLESILVFKDDIFERAQYERNNYLDYLKRESLLNKEIFFFDLVTSGTSVHFIKKLFKKEAVNSKVDLLCFAYINAEREYPGDLSYSWYGEQCYYSTMWALPNVYPPFEVLLSPRNGMFECFDENGQPCFTPMTDDECTQWDNYISPMQFKCDCAVASYFDKTGAGTQMEYSQEFCDALLLPLWPNNSHLIKRNSGLVLSNPYDANSKTNIVL